MKLAYGIPAPRKVRLSDLKHGLPAPKARILVDWINNELACEEADVTELKREGEAA